MQTFAASVTIQRPAAEVFRFISDFRNDPQWRAGVIELTLDAAPGVGTRTREVLLLGGRRLLTQGEIFSLEPEREIWFRSTSGPIPVQGCRRVEGDGEVCIFSSSYEVEFEGLWRLFSAVFSRQLQRRLAADLQRAKELLEHSAAS